MMEDKRAILVVQMLIEPEPRRGTGQRALKRRLPLGQRFAPHVGPVETRSGRMPTCGRRDTSAWISLVIARNFLDKADDAPP
jgi:hypothetical protein